MSKRGGARVAGVREEDAWSRWKVKDEDGRPRVVKAKKTIT